jgi:hypothetical protein
MQSEPGDEIWKQRFLDLYAAEWARQQPSRPYEVALARLRSLLFEQQKLDRKIEGARAELDAILNS